MKKMIMILLAVCLLASIAMAEETPVLDRDTLIQEYGLADSEYLEDFIKEFAITADFAKEINLEAIYNAYVINREAEKTDMSYLLKASRTEKEDAFGVEGIARVMWMMNTDSELFISLYDLQDSAVYYGHSNFLYDIKSAPKKELSHADQEALLSMLQENRVLEWKEIYPSEDDNSTSWTSWRLVLEYTNGDCFVSSASGSMAKELPESFDAVMASLSDVY